MVERMDWSEEPVSPGSIGVIGGMGPYAGTDLINKVFANTAAATDQEHLPVALLSYSHCIHDRNAYLLDGRGENPAATLLQIMLRLERLDVTVAGMACNSAHAPAIYDVVVEGLRAAGTRLRLLHIADETVRLIARELPGVRCVGLLSTSAVRQLGIYQERLAAAGYKTIVPTAEEQEQLVQPAIFDRTYGIKAQSAPVTDRVRTDLQHAVARLSARGAEGFILGCTELPLALRPGDCPGPIIDPTVALARALIHAVAPEKLKPLPALV